MNRRQWIKASLAAAPLAMFGVPGRGRAQVGGHRPSKLLTVHLPGGVHWEHFFDPFLTADIAAAFKGQVGYPFYGTDHVENFDRTPVGDRAAPRRAIRGPVWWNWEDPSQYGAGFDGKGYVWASPEHRLFERAAVIHGVDNQTAAHPSGIVASVCGVAGTTFAVPAVQAWVAHQMANAFPERVVPSVVIGRGVRAPQVSLASAVAATHLQVVDDLEWQLSDRPGHWDGMRERGPEELPGYGDDDVTEEELTMLDRLGLEAIRRMRGRSASSGTEAVLEGLYDNYRGFSRMIATDIVTRLEATEGFTYWPAVGPAPWSRLGMLGWAQGLADEFETGAEYERQFDLALRFLKSGLTTSVALRAPTASFDYHDGGPDAYFKAGYRLHGAMESLGRILVEMANTPSEGGRSLLDDTLVYVYSDFGRTFLGDDHNPMTTAVLVGGGVKGNQMVGGFSGDELGAAVPITGEDGAKENRAPKSQDVIATILAAFGVAPGEGGFFLPGGYGVVEGVVAEES